MDLVLTPAEVEQFRDALLSAFPSRGDLEQLVYFRLGEQLNQLVEGGNYTKVVFDLIVWANSHGKTETLLTQARSKNPGNSQLRLFEEQVRRNHNPQAASNQSPSPLTPAQQTQLTNAFTPALRMQVINALSILPVSSTFPGRSTLLADIEGSSSLNRDAGNAQLDFDLIINQLNGLGQLSSGKWPLLVLIDNALFYAGEFKQPAETLKTARQVLAKAYGVM